MLDNGKELKLIAFDLDGTFLDDQKAIPEENLQAIRAAAEHGIYIVPATGRLYDGLPAQLRELDFIRYFILINGAKVYDVKEDSVLFSADLPNELVLSLFENAESVGCLYDCYLRDEGLMSRGLYDALDDFVPDKVYLRYMRSIRKPVEDLKTLVREDGGPVQKVQYFFQDMQERRRQLDTLAERFPGIKVTSSLPMNIEINASNASKGPALDALCRRLGFTAENAMAFGDNTNDLDMLLTAGHGVAMKNSDAKLFPAADAVTSHDNNAAGVGKTIMEFLNQRSFL